MDAEAVLRLILFLLLLLMSGFFSGSETALFSLAPVQLMRLEEEKHPRAALLRQLLSQPRALIATIFIGNEFVNIGASALMASVINSHLQGQGQAVVTVLSTSISVTAILLLGELTPKNIAARIGERWALRAARPIRVLGVAMAPLRWTIERIADAVVHLTSGGQGAAEPPAQVGEEEFRTMVDVASRAGDIDKRERELIENIFDFGDRSVREVMTRAEDVFMLSYELPLSRLIEEVRHCTFSRIPVYRKRRDQIVGVLHAKDLIAVRYGVVGRPRRLADLLRSPFFVPPTIKCERLMREFRRHRMHQALVVDEYGRLRGLVTMEDLLEEVFGEIKDEKEVPHPTGEFPVVSMPLEERQDTGEPSVTLTGDIEGLPPPVALAEEDLLASQTALPALDDAVAALAVEAVADRADGSAGGAAVAVEEGAAEGDGSGKFLAREPVTGARDGEEPAEKPS